MEVICYKVDAELKKAAQGKRTKIDVGILLYTALEGYPKIQAGIARAFAIDARRE